MSGPLRGLKVLDLSRVLAGPFCTMLLCDLGATVIKVEKPGVGDDSRSFGPMIGAQSAYFMSINRGKKGITLDLKNPRGREILLELAEKSDVLVENFRPGAMEKLGLGYETIKERNSRIIYASSSGFGHTGPLKDRPAYDIIIQGMSGIMSITGFDEDNQSKVGSSIADILCGVFTAFAVLAALNNRHETGKGQYIDVAMLDCMIAVLENAILRYSVTGEIPKPVGNRHVSIAPFGTFECLDGKINIGVGNNQLWSNFCKALEISEFEKDRRFASNEARAENVNELTEIVNSRLRLRRTEEWLKIFGIMGIPSGKICNIAELFQNPQVIARNMIENMDCGGRRLSVAGIPLKFSETPASIEGPAPGLGEHNEEVLRDVLGMSAKEIEELRIEGAI